MATHSSVLAWRIPGTVEPGGLLSIGSHRVGHDWSDLAAAAVFTYHKEGLIFNSFIFPISFSFLQHCPMFIFAYLINNQSLCYCECNHFSCNPYKLLCLYFLSWILFWIKNCDVCVYVVCFIFYISITDSSPNSARVSVSQSVQSLSCVQLVTPWTAACQVSLSITNSRSLLKLMSMESVMPSNHLILCRPLSSQLQFFPASGSFLVSQFFTSGDQRIGVSASVLPMNIQDWFPFGYTGWMSLQSKRLPRVFSDTTIHINSLVLSFLYSPTLTSIHDYWKNHSFD